MHRKTLTYAFDPVINVQARMTPALAVVHQDDEESVFGKVTSSVQFRLLPIFDYFEDVFAGLAIARGQNTSLEA